ncbi:NUDIX domain-containing protein [Glutamicibacter endophyticus]|uniref:NUDIX domain-containing protein n=1 Tax=Glutamicibacter endophyticus TaxID=1522174 RepID=UPI003AEFE80D
MPVVTEKAVCYVVQDDHLLVFTHLQHLLQVTGVQVPAGSIHSGESPDRAAIRELREETGLTGSVVRSLGTATYDIRPARNEIARRHFFELSVAPQDLTRRWIAGETDPSHGGLPETWECWWLPLKQGHVLAAGLGALLGNLRTGSTQGA